MKNQTLKAGTEAAIAGANADSNGGCCNCDCGSGCQCGTDCGCKNCDCKDGQCKPR